MLSRCLGSLSVSLLLLCIPEAKARDDERCRCVCPPLGNVFNSSVLPVTGNAVNPEHMTKTVYIKKDILPDECKCENMLEGRLPNGSEIQTYNSFCLRCQCVFEKRNTTTQKVIIIFIMAIMAMLFVYALFLVAIEPLFQRLLRRQRRDAHRRAPSFLSNVNYEGDGGDNDRAAVYAPTDAEEEVKCLVQPGDGGASTSAAASGVMNSLVNRVRLTQEKWKEDVHEQRQNIFTRHNLLN